MIILTVWQKGLLSFYYSKEKSPFFLLPNQDLLAAGKEWGCIVKEEEEAEKNCRQEIGGP